MDCNGMLWPWRLRLPLHGPFSRVPLASTTAVRTPCWMLGTRPRGCRPVSRDFMKRAEWIIHDVSATEADEIAFAWFMVVA